MEPPTLVDDETGSNKEPTQIDLNAREFGNHFKQGGWRLGFLVAKSVEPKQGQRTDLRKCAEVSKVSQAEFARLAGISETNVRYYFRAWEIAAADGRCSKASELKPDDEMSGGPDQLEEDDLDLRELWSKYLEKARKPKVKKPVKQPPTVDDQIAAEAEIIAAGGQPAQSTEEPAPAKVVIELEEIAAHEEDYEMSCEYLKLALQLNSVARAMIERKRILTEERTTENIKKANALLAEFPFNVNGIVCQTTESERDGSNEQIDS